MILRPYQRKAVASCIDAMNRGEDPLLVLATGLGKTVIFTDIHQKWKHGRVMILAHREELVFQAASKAKDIGIEMAGFHQGTGKRVVAASVQSLANRLPRFPAHEFGLVIFDEAHHAVESNSSYAVIYNHFQQNSNCRFLGPTATPKRSDHVCLRGFFNTVAYQYDLLEAIDDGYLVPITHKSIDVGYDLSRVQKVGNNFNLGQLARALIWGDVPHAMVSNILQYSENIPTLVSAASIEHAHTLAALLNSRKQNSALALSSLDSKQLRREALKRFHARQFQYLISCNLFTEGFDAPHIGVVAMCKPMLSLLPYLQILGRGTRTLPGVVDNVQNGAFEAYRRREAISKSAKPRLLTLDFVGNSGRHQLVSVKDALSGEEPKQKVSKATWFLPVVKWLTPKSKPKPQKSLWRRLVKWAEKRTK